MTHFLELFLEALRSDSPTLATAVRPSRAHMRHALAPADVASRAQLRSRYERALGRDPALEAALDRAEAARWPEAYPAEAPFGLGALLASLTA